MSFEKVNVQPMETYSGTLFDFQDIQENDISIKDIAVHLSRQCRYNGATNRFYSVAEHSLIMAWSLHRYLTSLSPMRFEETGILTSTVTDEAKNKAIADIVLCALLHDAGEAYIGDIAYPVRQVLNVVAPGVLDAIEASITNKVFSRFDIPFDFERLPDLVNAMDRLIFYYERRTLFTSAGTGAKEFTLDGVWRDYANIDFWSHPMFHADPANLFLRTFYTFTGLRETPEQATVHNTVMRDITDNLHGFEFFERATV